MALRVGVPELRWAVVALPPRLCFLGQLVVALLIMIISSFLHSEMFWSSFLPLPNLKLLLLVN